MAAGLGHNGGPTMTPGTGWQRHAWTRARRDLLPRLPIEVLRRRVARARELGLEYPLYATVRATTGCDIVAFLFSSNALRVAAQAADMPPERVAALAAINNADRRLLVQGGHAPEALRAALVARHGPVLEAAATAPRPFAGWSETRAGLAAALAQGRLRPDEVLLVSETALEREWCAAGRLAGTVPAARYFGDATP